MRVLQLSKQETMDLEKNSKKSFSHEHTGQNRERALSIMRKQLGLHHWQYVHGNKSDNFYQECRLLTKLLGYKYNYFITYWVRNACWGLCLEGIPNSKFLVYWCVEGLSVQFQNGMSLDTQEKVVDHLCDLMVKGKKNDEIWAEITSKAKNA